MSERELRRWGNAWVFVAGLGVVLNFTTYGNWLINVIMTAAALIIANITWLRADIARGRA